MHRGADEDEGEAVVGDEVAGQRVAVRVHTELAQHLRK